MVPGTVLGVDVGGSKTHGALVRSGELIAESYVGSANVSSVGLEEATRQLELMLADLGPDPVEAICVGMAGAEATQAELHDVIARLVPNTPIRVVHDTRLVLAAAGLDDGAVIISGTGSAAWARHDGAEARAGGWGFILGDDGGAYGVMKAALRHALHLLDSQQPPDRLTLELLRACGVAETHELMDVFYKKASRRDWAGRASLLFDLAEAGDGPSTAIVEAAARELVQAVGRVLDALDFAGPVVMSGGMVRNQPLLQTLIRKLLADRGTSDVRLLDRDPVYGAVDLAQDLSR